MKLSSSRSSSSAVLETGFLSRLLFEFGARDSLLFRGALRSRASEVSLLPLREREVRGALRSRSLLVFEFEFDVRGPLRE